jgi:DNA-binding PadR family transcriptional regulator
MDETHPDWLFHPLTLTELYTLIILARHSGGAYYIAQFINENFQTTATTSGIKAALKRLEQHGLIKSDPYIIRSGRNEKLYRLTDWGVDQLTFELNRLEPILLLGRDHLVLR